jgi:hypothetical protein
MTIDFSGIGSARVIVLLLSVAVAVVSHQQMLFDKMKAW